VHSPGTGGHQEHSRAAVRGSGYSPAGPAMPGRDERGVWGDGREERGVWGDGGHRTQLHVGQDLASPQRIDSYCIL